MQGRDHVLLGQAGEDAACRELTRLGYAVLARRYRTRYGEIDIVARDGTTVVFVEVKARCGTGYGLPAEAVTLDKQARLTAMAEDFVSRRGLEGVACRFDVVAVSYDHGPQRRPRIEVIRSAFDACEGRASR